MQGAFRFPYRPEVDHLSAEVAEDHLAFYSELLVAEAREDFRHARTENDFLISVGAVSLMCLRYVPQYIARSALEASYGLVAVEAAYPSMAHWTNIEWQQHIEGAFQSFQPRPGEKLPPDDGIDGYIMMLEVLRRRGRYPMRPGISADPVSGGRHYVFSGRGKRARGWVPKR